MAALSTSTWGDPRATKRVLLIHGITSSSLSWHRIAPEFASRGYFVIAPDLLGHGNARRSSDYTMAALVEELHPLFKTPAGNDHPYHIVVGHSLGGLVASALLPLLKSTRPVRVVLSDPPFEQPPEGVAFYRKVFGDNVRNPKTPEGYLQEFPSWTKEDTVVRSTDVRLCDVSAVEGILDQNVPWSFWHYLSSVPENVKVTVLAADPSKEPCMKVEDLKPYPHVDRKTVWGSSHSIPFEVPQAIFEAAFEGTQVQN